MPYYLTDEFDIAIRTDFGVSNFKLNSYDLMDSNANENLAGKQDKYPSLTVTGIPTNSVNEPFEVSLATDIPCKLISSTNQQVIGDTDGKNPIKFLVKDGNGTYNIICQPLSDGTDEFRYLEKVNSFEVTCFSSDYKKPVSDEDIDNDIVLDDEDLPPVDDNTPDIDNGGNLEQTGIDAGTRLWISIGVFLTLGIVFLAIYKKDKFKRFFSLFIILALLGTSIQLPNFVTEVKAGDNETTGGSQTSNNTPTNIAGSGSLCYDTYVNTYLLYPVDKTCLNAIPGDNLGDVYRNTSGIYYGWADTDVLKALNEASSTMLNSKGVMLYGLASDGYNSSAKYTTLRNIGTASNPQHNWFSVPKVTHVDFNARINALNTKYGWSLPTLNYNSFYFPNDKRVFTTSVVSDLFNKLDTYSVESLDVKADILNTLLGVNSYNKFNCANIMLVSEYCISPLVDGYTTRYSMSVLGTESHIHNDIHGGHTADNLCASLKSDSAYGKFVIVQGDANKDGVKDIHNLNSNCIMAFWVYNWEAGTAGGLRQASDYFYNTKFNKKPTGVGSLAINSPNRTRTSGVIFTLTDDKIPEPITYDYNYTILARGSSGGFTTNYTDMSLNTTLVRRTRQLQGGKVIKTTYSYVKDTAGNYSQEYSTVDALLAALGTTYNSLSSGYAFYDANLEYTSVFHRFLKDTVTAMNTADINYRWVGSSVYGGSFNAGATYKYEENQTYGRGLSNIISWAGTPGSSQQSSSPYGMIYNPLQLSDFNTVQRNAFDIYTNHGKFAWSLGQNCCKVTSDFSSGSELKIPVISFTQYKPVNVASSVYEVELTYDGSKYVPKAPKKVTGLSYSVDKYGSYTINLPNTKYVVISSSSVVNNTTGVSSLSGFNSLYGTYVSAGAASKGNTINVGATSSGTGYNVYVFTLKGITNLNMEKTYTLEPYMLNRLYSTLGNNGVVYTLTDTDLTYFNGSGNVAKADLYQIAGVNGLTFKAGLLSGNLKNCGSGSNNLPSNTAITYSTGDNHRIFAGYNTGTAYKKVSILDSYSLALSRGIRGDKKILSSIAVGTDKTSVDGISSSNRTKFNLGYGLKGNTPNSAYKSATFKNYTFADDVNTLRVEGRYPYNNKSGNTYQSILPTSGSYNSVKYNRTVNGGVEGDSNYLLGWSGSTGNRYRTLNFTVKAKIESYNSGALAEGKANANKTFVSNANKTIVAKDNTNVHLKFYPEVYMMYYNSPTSANYKVPVMSEYLRQVQGSSLYGFKSLSSGTPTGQTISDMTASNGTTYRGSDVTLVVNNTGTKFEAFGYSLDILNQSTDSFNNSIVGNNNVYSAWGNSGTATTLKNDFNDWIQSQLTEVSADVTLNVSNGKSYSDFDISNSGMTLDINATTNDKTYAITVKNGKLVEDTNYTNLINQIASDYGITQAEAKNYFAQSNMVKSIIDSMETCLNSRNTSEAMSSITAGGHWYDEFTRTFVIRRFSNNTVLLGNITIQDKIDINANTSTTSGSGINQTIKGNDVTANWKLTIKKGDNIFVDSNISGASFKISYLTTED